MKPSLPIEDIFVLKEGEPVLLPDEQLRQTDKSYDENIDINNEIVR